jgi:prepilin-type N-terminal cleavage/methylation domain-containing protein/prepilin-type processing-associated H-X9-DG protein
LSLRKSTNDDSNLKGNVMQKRHVGFTLIELLVVISIISLLISILLPALSNARAVARSAGCLSNQKQIAVALFAYATENNDYPPSDVPHDSLGNQYGAWYERLYTTIYGADIDDAAARAPHAVPGSSVFTCPSDPCVDIYKIARSYMGNWAISGYYNDSNDTWSAHQRISDFIHPGKDWYIVEDWGSDTTSVSTGNKKDYLSSTHSFWQAARADRMNQGALLVHNKGFNVLFLDGHAVTFKGGPDLEVLIASSSKVFWAE